jgi:hypothetical protein
MAGIGKYKKGAKFTLKSGNNPTFVQMGSSPAKISGIGARITGTKGGFTPDIDYRPSSEESDSPNKGGLRHFTINERPRTDSPNNLNNFGIGPGGSPWKQGDDKTETDAEITARKKKEKADSEVITDGGTLKPGEKAKAGDRKEPTWLKGLKIGTTLLSGGIQGVYGGARHAPKINWGKWTQEELDEAASSRISKDILESETKTNPHVAGTEAHAEWEKKNKEEKNIKKDENIDINIENVQE